MLKQLKIEEKATEFKEKIKLSMDECEGERGEAVVAKL
jgi:hypothetical protein